MESVEPNLEEEIQRARKAIASRFLKGNGLEVGAGSRPFPVPDDVQVCYGDIRGSASLESYFQNSAIQAGDEIDAQTFAGVDTGSFDFVISAHVIEHLRDPVGSIVEAVRVLKPGGVLVLVVPDLRYTFDYSRPETTVEHALRDYQDGGASTTRDGYEEHLRYVHPYLTGENYPEAEIQRQATECVKRWRELDVHFHAWTRDGFETLLSAIAELAPFDLEAAQFAVNENIFVLRKDLEASRESASG
jgi:SAM-dependent methyltransferase